MGLCMSILQQYFNSFHHLPPPPQVSHVAPLEQSPEALSILLSANSRNISFFMRCQSFMDILPNSIHSIGIKESYLLDSVLDMQSFILKENPHIFDELLPYFARLNLASVIDNDEFALFASFKNQAVQIAENKLSAKKQQDIKSLRLVFYDIHNKIASLFPIEAQATFEGIRQKLEKQHLCIGVTGVLSAGKSTFLNALLSQEILGSSNVPETANLTILSYGEELGAKVHYWSKEQWEDLCTQSVYDENLKSFVAECQSHFGDELHKLITEPHTIKEINADELSAYTSANHPSKLCNLIQKVELFTPLEFLKNGVEIVDTPGLDDPITKREDITRSFLQHCDMLIHVMNASCAATQKDIDFILESLLEQNISRLLVVLTRIDLLSESEIQSSLEYTKKSLVTQLKKANYKGDIASIIARIDFIPLAGYVALVHRVNGDTSKLTMSLEQSGILDIESYLHKMLLGENSLKAKDTLYIAYKATQKQVQEAYDLLKLESTLLSASNDELEMLIANEKAHNDALLLELKSLQTHFDALYNELNDFLHTLQLFSANILSKVATILKDKIFDDIVYDYKRGVKSQSSNLYKMIEISLKDCFADITREYRYKLSRKITQLKLAITSYDDNKLPPIHFGLKNSEIAHIMQPILTTFPPLIDLANKEDSLRNGLDRIFKELFGAFALLIDGKNEEISTIFLAYFDEITQNQKSYIHTQIAQKEQSLQAALTKREQGDTTIKQDIDIKCMNLKNIVDEIEGLLHNFQ